MVDIDLRWTGRLFHKDEAAAVNERPPNVTLEWQVIMSAADNTVVGGRWCSGNGYSKPYGKVKVLHLYTA